ncbi:hypothetical protein MKX01_019121 [Papaver californicum]|nr:hypothetical protein MKX01_019121 [Papaver californicum]
MRSGVTIIHTSLSTSSPQSLLSPSVVAAAPIHSPWHSPIPYLFGGLAAMLGLIAFALLILACSYWKLSAFLDNDSERSRNDLENGDNDDNKSIEDGTIKVHIVYEEKIVVIMAGDVKPTYLATPIDYPYTTSSLEVSNEMSSLDDKTKEKEEESDVRVETESREAIDENPHQHHQNH